MNGAGNPGPGGTGKVGRDDLEAKLREIEDVVVDAEGEARKGARMIIAGVVVVSVLLVGYAVWRARRRQIRVEVYYQ